MKRTITSITLIFTLLCIGNFALADSDAFIRRGKIKKKRTTGYSVVTVVSKKMDGLSSVSATITAKESTSPQPKLKTFTMDVVRKNKKGHYVVEADLNCERGICLFGKDANTVGETYTITLKLLDSTGKQIGSSESFNVEVELEKVKKVKVTSVILEGLNYFGPNTKDNDEGSVLVTKNKASVSGYHICFETELVGGALHYSPSPDEIYLNAKVVVEDFKTEGTTTYNISAVYNDTTKRYEANWGGDDYVRTISVDVRYLSTYGSSYVVTANKKDHFKILSVNNGNISLAVKKLTNENSGGTGDSTNTCTNNIGIGTATTASLTTIGGVSVIDVANVTFSDNSSSSNSAITDLTVNAIVELIGCDGKPYFITLPMTYNDKTSTYTVSKALTKCVTGEYKLQSITFKAKDSCGNGSVWVRGWQWS